MRFEVQDLSARRPRRRDGAWSPSGGGEPASESGIAVVSSPHTTAGITVNENADPDVVRDLLHGLERISPREGGGATSRATATRTSRRRLSARARRCRSLTADSRSVRGRPIYLAEFDGPRTRYARRDGAFRASR